MKILLTESQINELNKSIKNEFEILYRDNNVLCMIPKTQRASNIYGHKTKWCQTTNGFNAWSKMGLLIRFIFKNGRKIRFTYYFKNEQTSTHYYWANENGYHVLEYFGNPFTPEPHNPDRPKDTEKDIIHLISLIPNECKNKVLEFIDKHKENYDYCREYDTYSSHKEKKINNTIDNLKEKYKNEIDNIIQNGNYLAFYEKDNEIHFDYSGKNENKINYITLNHFNQIEDTLINIINQIKKGQE